VKVVALFSPIESGARIESMIPTDLHVTPFNHDISNSSL